MKTVIVILSDPKNGGEEALGRLFNGLAVAYDFKNKGDEVKILFQGTGVRWASEIVQAEHPAHALYDAVKSQIVGASCACTDVFGATESVKKSGFDLIRDNKVPGTSGLPSLQSLMAADFHVLTF